MSSAVIITEGMDPTSLEFRKIAAQNDVFSAQSTLATAIIKIGMSNGINNYGQSPHTELASAIEAYVTAKVKAECLRILGSEDFYLAMAHSASKVANQL